MVKPARIALCLLGMTAIIVLPGIWRVRASSDEPIVAVAGPAASPAGAVAQDARPQIKGRPPMRTPAAGDGWQVQPGGGSHADSGGWLWPTPSRLITSPFGFRVDPFTGATAFHSGIDLGDPCGTGVGATRAGTVTFAGPAGGYGLRVVVDHGDRLSSSYSHLRAIAVEVGDHVSRGQLLGEVGTTGRSTGCHLHFEIMFDGAFTDPVPYLTGQPAANPATWGNGAVAPAPIQDATGQPGPVPGNSTDPCRPVDDPRAARDGGGLIPLPSTPGPSASSFPSGYPCPSGSPGPSGTPASSAPPGPSGDGDPDGAPDHGNTPTATPTHPGSSDGPGPDPATPSTPSTEQPPDTPQASTGQTSGSSVTQGEDPSALPGQSSSVMP